MLKICQPNWSALGAKFVLNRSTPAPSRNNEGANRDTTKWEKVNGVCALMRAAASSNSNVILKIAFRDNQLLYCLSATNLDEHTEPHSEVWLSKPLADYLQGSGTPFTLKDVRRRERLVLAVLLAHSILHFFEGPWYQGKLDPKKIFFTQSREGKVPQFRKPYLATECIAPVPVHLKARPWDHPYPILHSFGILLLGLWKGEMVNVSDLDDAYDSAKDETETEFGDSFDPYFNAMDACLGIVCFAPGGSFNNEEFLDMIWESIICPLEKALYDSFSALRGKLNLPTSMTDVLCPSALKRMTSHTTTSIHTESGADNEQWKPPTGGDSKVAQRASETPARSTPTSNPTLSSANHDGSSSIDRATEKE